MSADQREVEHLSMVISYNLRKVFTEKLGDESLDILSMPIDIDRLGCQLMKFGCGYLLRYR